MPPSRSQTGLRLAVVRREKEGGFAGLAGAVLLHVGVVAATLFSWPHSLDIAKETPPFVPVELVTIGDTTSIKAMTREEPKEDPLEEQTPQPEEMEAVPPPEERVETKPEPKTEPAPAKDKAPEKAKPEKKPVEKKKEQFDINNIMALLDKKVPKSATRSATKGDRNIKGVGAQDAMTMQLIDALRNQIIPCWSPPVGAPNAAQLVVTFELFLNQDGSVARPPQFEGNSGDPYWRAAAEAARRAVLTCAPYKLPADKYQQWKEITLDFDPRKMLGQ